MGEFPSAVSPAKVFARPTADDVWLGTAQQAALSQLSRRVPTRLLVGPPSSGKSAILSHFASSTRAESVVLVCRGPKEDATALLASLLLAADLAPWDLSEVEQRNLFTVFVQQRRAQGRRVAVAVDDAHLLKDAAWHELQRLACYRIRKQPALELVLIGPETLSRRVDAAAFDLPEDAILTHAVTAPSVQELNDYIAWRLSRFALQDVITPVARQMFARLSGGRFAAVDVYCQMALLLLKQLRLDRVDARVARQALATLAARQSARLDPEAPAAPRRSLESTPAGHLLVSREGNVIARVALGQRTLLGRSEHNDVCLPSPYLSRHHAVIVGTPEGYYVVDLSSANGVALNGRPVERAVLCDQDVLSLGAYRIKVQIPGWLPQGDPLPPEESLADTVILPPQEQAASAAQMRRVK